MCAKVLVPSSDQTEVGSLARIERLERRIGMGGAAPVSAAPVAAIPTAAAAQKPIPEVVPATEAIEVVQAPASAGQLGAVTTQQFKDSWAEILTLVNKESKSAWMVAFSLTVIDFTDDVLTLKFMSQKDLESLKNSAGASDVLRKAIFDVLGVQVKFKPLVTEAEPAPATRPIAVVEVPAPAVDKAPIDDAPITDAPLESEPIDVPQAAEPALEEPAAKKPTKSRNSGMADESARYGESLLREMLGAEPMPDKNGGR
jgi:DNA polymerase-3 subunit gamma/tau